MLQTTNERLGAEWRPEDDDRVRRIAQAAASIVRREAPFHGRARRDQHAKHHGCVWGYLEVLPELPPELRHGVFAAPRRYLAWIRFSNSSSRAAPDTQLDGRGVAIKLLEVEGERPLLAELSGQRTTQDFILLNHSAFFAEDLEEMTRIFEWLEKKRSLPSYFLAHFWRLRGLWALYKLATRPETPLALTYYSQLPFRLGPSAVKARLRPVSGIVAAKASRAEKASEDHLRHVMRRQLRPNVRDQRLAREQLIPPQRAPESDGDAVFAFELQSRQPRDSIERGDKSWTGPFEQVAVLRIPHQDFDAPERMQFAEDAAFSVWNALDAHAPLGKLNRARAEVYAQISRLRNELNHAAPPAYDRAEWLRLRALPAGPRPRLDHLPDVLSPLEPGNLLGLPLRLLSSRWGALVPLLTFAAIMFVLIRWPERVGKAVPVLAPLEALGLALTSEQLIPGVELSPTYLKRRAKQPKPADPENDLGDPVWTFRYGSMGAEFSAGIPYWIYRVLPKVVPEEFGSRGDWSAFGFEQRDDQDYYTSYHRLPRGLVLSDTVVRLGNVDYELRLKRVALNCASCHRGEYLDEQGNPHFLDGMPNLGFDAAAFKRHTTAALVSPRFTEGRVIDEIDKALAEEHRLQGKSGPTPRLSPLERIVYGKLVRYMRAQAAQKEALLGWIDRRPANGPGRLDAFSALRFEQLGFADKNDKLIATVDLPSIWRQGPETRPRHHYDGNTAEARARNVGAIVGVGGHPLSIRFENVQRVANWIDQQLAPPTYPFTRDPQAAARGKEIYTQRCAGCHGSYDAESKLLKGPTPCMSGKEPKNVGTDRSRLEAIDQDYLKALNTFGERGGLWTESSFELSKGYLCPPLDGIWARAPYLHNGSVPTLDHLLSGKRPEQFTRGNPAYDQEHGGFVWDQPPADGRLSADLFVKEQGKDVPGNSAAGHDDPNTQIVEDAKQRADLIQYLYTL